MSEQDYLKKAEEILILWESRPQESWVNQRIIALVLLDIAKTLREIKAMAEREVEDGKADA